MFESLGNLIACRVLGLDVGSALGDAVQFFVMDVARIFVLLMVVTDLSRWEGPEVWFRTQNIRTVHPSNISWALNEKSPVLWEWYVTEGG